MPSRVDSSTDKTYDRLDDGRYPYRDITGSSIRARVAFDEDQFPGDADAREYLKNMSRGERSRLYNEKMRVVPFQVEHAKNLMELNFVGTSLKTVELTRDVFEGECLGVVPGVVFFPSNLTQNLVGDQSRFVLLEIPHSAEKIYLDMRGILGEILTVAHYDEYGRVLRESENEEDFNADMVRKPALLQFHPENIPGNRSQKSQHSVVCAPLVYMTKDGKAGDQLRMAYKWTDDVARSRLG